MDTGTGEFIEAVIESADFGPFYEGESFVTVTFRVPVDTRCPAGVWEIRPKEMARPLWSKAKAESPAHGDSNER